MLISGLVPCSEAGEREKGKGKGHREGVVKLRALQAGLPGTELSV